MKRIRMPAISATIGATAMPMIMRSPGRWLTRNFPPCAASAHDGRLMYGDQLPALPGRLPAQHEVAAVVDAHFEEVIGGIGPAVENRRHRQAALGQGLTQVNT